MLSIQEKSALAELAEKLKARINDDDLAKLRAQITVKQDYSKYVGRPYEYARDVLKVDWIEEQVHIATSILIHPKVSIRSSNGYGKSHVFGGMVNFLHDTLVPGLVLTTAPTEDSVIDVLWKEIRVQRRGRPGLMPKEPHLSTAPNHFAKGYTARDVTAFGGRREKNLFVIFDEAIGVTEPFWTAAKGMLTGINHHWVVGYNPLDSASFLYNEENNLENDWYVIVLNALNHPNIKLQLEGKPPLIEAAVTLQWVNSRVKEWCRPIEKDEFKPTSDVEWPPQSGNYYRPNASFEARVLGRWPSTSVYAIWSEGVIQACETTKHEIKKDLYMPEIGCDVARQGYNESVIYIRWDKSIVYREARQGSEYGFTARRLRDLANEWGQKANVEGTKIPVKIDAGGGYGEAVFELRDKHRFILVNGVNRAIRENNYHNRRSELWFTTFLNAEDGFIEWSRLQEDEKRKLRKQLLATRYRFDNKNRLQVASKEETKRDAGGSPDEADALNLACTNFLQRDSAAMKTEEKMKKAPIKDRYERVVNAKDSKTWMLG